MKATQHVHTAVVTTDLMTQMQPASVHRDSAAAHVFTTRYNQSVQLRQIHQLSATQRDT